MSDASRKKFGCYSPLPKRPEVPPQEYFKKHEGSQARNSVQKMRPRELAALCYSHYDGRSQLSHSVNKEPQEKIM